VYPRDPSKSVESSVTCRNGKPVVTCDDMRRWSFADAAELYYLKEEKLADKGVTLLLIDMELTDDNLVTLSEYLKHTLSPDVNVRRPGWYNL